MYTNLRRIQELAPAPSSSALWTITSMVQLFSEVSQLALLLKISENSNSTEQPSCRKARQLHPEQDRFRDKWS
jgi:hypothetical protein